MLRRIKNLIGSRSGWSFTARPPHINRRVLVPGEEVVFSGNVVNDGLRLGTAYVRILVADSYQLDSPIFDSNRDLPHNSRHALRLLDIEPGSSRAFACKWQVPQMEPNHHFDAKVEVWNPHLLFGGPHPYCFYSSGWAVGFEVVEKISKDSNIDAFISYSWDSEEHKEWVRELSEELRKYNIDPILDQRHLHAGDESALFMERGVQEAKIKLLICTETYTRKANNREAGAGYETVISAHEYMMCPMNERGAFIPIVRNNALPNGRKLPTYLGSTIYIDMSGDNWRAEPMLDLVASISRHST